MLLSMELSLNLLWLLLAVASFALVGRGRGNRTLAGWHSWRRTFSLACALVILFPVISVTDDLHAEQAVMEDSNPTKRIGKSCSAPGAALNPDRSSLPFLLVATGLLPRPSLRLLGLTVLQEIRFLAAAPAGRTNPRAPPSPMCPA